MRFLCVALATICHAIVIDIVQAQDSDNENRTTGTTAADVDSEEDAAPVDQYTFVALMDIIFTDGSKKLCTGTIIHDYVVITAAHCFIQDNEEVRPELTASFVVIGTKKMFATGYEQYLPIERIITHPNHDGWTADLSLVYTFAAMTSDKPGTIMPISARKTAAPVDSNITVLSWGNFEDDEMPKRIGMTASIPVRSHLRTFLNSTRKAEEPEKNLTQYENTRKRPEISIKQGQWNRARKDIFKKIPNNPFSSRYLASKQIRLNKARDEISEMSHRIENEDAKRYKTHYKNWRRLMGPKKEKLGVEAFGFVNMQTCKKVIEMASPNYNPKDSYDYICYVSDDGHITARDSGAPVIHKGKLVAVTIGGSDCDGDYVAVGLKMSCYCSWIVENLPDKSMNLMCCKNCCDVNHVKEELKANLRSQDEIYL